MLRRLITETGNIAIISARQDVWSSRMFVARVVSAGAKFIAALPSLQNAISSKFELRHYRVKS